MLPGRPKATAERYRILSGICPDESCKTKLYFPSYDTSIECSNCGQRHPRSAMTDTEEVTDPEVALHNMVRNLLVGNFTPKKTADSIKVLGLSNYHCKLLSPLLTYYGMDKQDKARPLREITQKDVFDCSVLGSRAFLIQPEHIGIMGYGRDQTGSAKYLSQTLQMIYNFHGGEEVLIPIHADGDGHCLVHGISRALVGRELFWHALRTNLKMHFLENLERYKNLFCDFVDSKEWEIIIAESDPDYLPGPNEAFGLQNIHIFGLANVLHRPIILLDSLSGLQSSGDYTGVFLPGLVPPDQCCGKDGKLNKPLCVAWSSSGRNHFIALVGVKGRPLPRLPRWMLTKAWGVPHELITSYIEFDKDDMCVVGGDRSLQDKYIQRLATAMEEVFLEKYSVHPSVVADVHHYIYKQTGVVGVQQDIIIANTRRTVQDNQLYRCLMCKAVSQIESHRISPERLRPGGDLYEGAKQSYMVLDPTKLYSMPTEDINFTYDPVKDVLVVNQRPQSSQCAWCQGKYLRLLSADGSVSYLNGDRTATPAPMSKCNCGYKHYWDGKEYDNHPSIFPVKMTWKGETVTEDVVWFQNETVSTLNSNAFEVASVLVQKNFPGEFGSEKIVQEVVATILQNTAKAESTYEPISLKDMPTEHGEPSSSTGEHRIGKGRKTMKDDVNKCVAAGKKVGSPKEKEVAPPGPGQIASKIILTGHSNKTLHKEELTMSQAERNLKKRIEHMAPVRQRQKSEQQQPQSKATIDEPPQKMATGAGIKKGGKEGEGSVDVSPEQKKAAPPCVKKVRVTTSDGRQVTVTLESNLTFSQLQAKIQSELQIPAKQQRIRCGFPPKELRRPEEGEENEPLPLQNGDKIMVEVLPDPCKPKESHMDTGTSPSYTKGSGIQSNIAEENSAADIAMASEIMKNLERLQQGGSTTDELDMQVNTLPLLATLTGLDLWTYAQRNPHLFDNGGLYYRIVQRDLGLVDGKHCTLPNLTTKKFYYNGTDDRLELCLEPLGHFPVSVGVEDPQRLAEIAAGQSTSRTSHKSEEVKGRGSLSAGGSGIVNRSSHQKKDTYVAFGGHAHTLSSAMTGSAKEQDVRPKVRNANPRSISNPKAISTSSHSLGQSDESSSIPNTTMESNKGFGLTNSQSNSMDGEQGHISRDVAAMETDTVGMDQVDDNQSGPSSPMEVDQSRDFPTIVDQAVHGFPTEHSTVASSVLESDNSKNAAEADIEQAGSTTSRNPVYISKKLGPGYTVLMKQPDLGPSHSTTQGEDDDGGDT